MQTLLSRFLLHFAIKHSTFIFVEFSSFQLLSRVRLFVTP